MNFQRRRHLVTLLTIAALGTQVLASKKSEDAPGSHSRSVVDFLNIFRNVGALIVFAEPNEFGLPPGIVAFCSGTLIDERVFLTAGHCTGPGSFAPLPALHQGLRQPQPERLGKVNVDAGD